jgi:hypothetical protein
MNWRAKSNELAPDMQKTLGQLISGVYLIGTLVLVTYALFFLSAGFSGDPGDWGALGDYFGGLMNPIVSFATLVVAYAVWKQQREELRHTKDALEDQAKTAEQQRQEQRFFDLMGLYHATVNSITMVARMSSRSEFPVQYSGKEAIAHFFRSGTKTAQAVGVFLEHGFYDRKPTPPHAEGLSIPDTRPETFNTASLHQAWNREENAAVFDHYFRVVFRILTDSEELLADQHFRYVKLLRAQLSRHELMLIGLNLWLDSEGRKMIPLAAKYGLLKHLPPSKLRDELECTLPLQVFGQTFAKRSRKQ